MGPLGRTKGIVAAALVGMAILLALSVPSTVRGSPPVEVLYENCTGLLYENGLYYHIIVLRNYGSETVEVVVKLKTMGDYVEKTSDPVKICPGCVVTVRLCALDCTPPPATQTPEQQAMMIEGLRNPQYIRVEYSGTSSGGIPGFPIESIFAGLLVGIAVLVMFRRKSRTLQ